MMVNLMRTNQRWLMIVISVLVLISFLWFFSNRTDIDKMSSDRVGKMYGRSVTTTELQRVARQIQTAHDLRLTNVAPPQMTQLSDAAFFDHLVMQHEAQAFGIVPSDSEVEEAEQKLAVFQGDGGAFDSSKYADFVEKKLSPRGFSAAQLDELVREDLQFGKLRELIDATVVVTPTEVRTTYEQGYSKAEAAVVRFKTSDFAAGIEPSEEDIKKTYDSQRDTYTKPESRKVQYIRFGLDDAQKKLTGEERMNAIKPLADRAAAFLEKLAEQKGKADFAALAKADELPVKETAEFEQDQTTGLEEASIAQFVPSAYRLTQAEPDSDVPLRTPDAFYVLHLSGLTPSRPLTLDEARPKVIAAIKDERARAALTARAEEVRTKIDEGMKAGKSFADAAKEAGQIPANIPPFSLAEPPPQSAGPDTAEISTAVSDLGVGELSKLVTTADGGTLVYLRDRKGIDESQFDQRKENFAMRIRRQKAYAAFQEWLRVSKEAANVQFDAPSRG